MLNKAFARAVCFSELSSRRSETARLEDGKEAVSKSAAAEESCGNFQKIPSPRSKPRNPVVTAKLVELLRKHTSQMPQPVKMDKGDTALSTEILRNSFAVSDLCCQCIHEQDSSYWFWHLCLELPAAGNLGLNSFLVRWQVHYLQRASCYCCLHMVPAGCFSVSRFNILHAMIFELWSQQLHRPSP